MADQAGATRRRRSGQIMGRIIERGGRHREPPQPGCAEEEDAAGESIGFRAIRVDRGRELALRSARDVMA